MTVTNLREKTYDPLQTLRDRVLALEQRAEEAESRIAMTDRRIGKLIAWREKRKRYLELRGFRNRAIRALVALDKLTLVEIGQAFGISPQRVTHLSKAPGKLGRPRKERAEP